MTAVEPASPVTEGMRSLEVRWIFPGEIASPLAGWFGRFPSGVESREDSYLLDPYLPGLSVKLRAGGLLEVKMYRGSPGVLAVGDRARGRMESWQKWSFPFGPPSQAGEEAAGWRPLRKRISRFALAGGQIQARDPRLGEEPWCTVELTEVRTRGEAWWTLAFEATGPAGLLHGELEATAALVFAESLPGGVELGTNDAMSYAEWLRRQHDAG
jgi:hypothetical protein